MSLMRWQPWQELETVRRQLDQLFDEMAPLSREGLMTTVNRAVRVPAIELKATDTEVILKAEIPGIEGKDLDIQVTRDAVAIKGEYQSEEPSEGQQIYRSEFRYGSFHRVIPLPVEVDNEQAKADFTHGVLTLTLPKLTVDRHKVVKVAIGTVPTETPVADRTEG